MLRGISQTSAQAKKYHNDSLTREGYYSEGQEMVGEWGGIGAARLGLTGKVGKEAYDRLCDNLHPATGEKLTLRMKENRRSSCDFNFNVPKSVSLAYEWKKDERILQAAMLSVRETMAQIEADAATRVRKGGRDEDRKTGELVWAEYIHFTARPEKGTPDPHLHWHCTTFNATFDKEEDCWKAAQLGDIMEKLPHYQAAFHTRLAKRLRELGYDTITQGISFELAGISRSLVKKFSRRGAAVEARAEAMGITDPADKDKLAALTREKKNKELDRSELHALWWSRLTPEDKRELNSLGRGREREPELEPPTRAGQVLGKSDRPLTVAQAIQGKATRALSDREAGEPSKATEHDFEAVDFAVKHIFYTASVVTETELMTEALRWGCGSATVEGVKAALKEFPLVRLDQDGRNLVTIPAVILEEGRIVDRCQSGIGKFPTLNSRWRIQDERLNAQQRAAVSHVLDSREFITGIVGKAGVGKTTTLLEAARGIEAAGTKVMAFAPTAVASRGTLRESGFPQAETIDKLLVSEKLQAKARGGVWFVDEGGLMSARTADKLLGLADRLGARVVLVGDTGQHHSVERGDAFRLLQEMGGMSVVTIDQIQRQRGLYREAVDQISKGRHAEAFDTFERMGAIFEIPDNETRYQTMAADYVSVVKKGKTALLVAPTHLECDLITEKVRNALKENRTLSDGRDWNILRNLSWSPAQKTDGRCYEPGLVVKVGGHLPGFARGEKLEVVEATKGKVVVRGENGQRRSFPLSETDKFSVYEPDRIEVCKGDQLRITINTRSEEGHALNNGKAYAVKEFSPDGGIVLENGWSLGGEFEHLDYGYTNTSHSAQSKTVDVILVAQSGLISSAATDAKQFYTAVSRGREYPHIYTEQKEGLRENVGRVRKRELAMEIIAERDREIEEREKQATREEPEAVAVVDAVQEKASKQLGEREDKSARSSGVLREYVPDDREHDGAAEAAQAERTAERLGTERVMAQAADWIPKATGKAPERETDLELEM